MATPSLGELGIWTWLDSLSFPEAIRFAQGCEALGYGTLWVPEAVGRDPFVLLTALATQTQSLRLATGIANIYARDPMAMNAARRSLDELSGGRLVLGLGVSHPEMVSSLRQHEYGKPLSTMRNYVQAMQQSFYAGPAPEQSGPVMLAALREKMLGLSAEVADGAHPYFVTPEHTARAREILGPGKLLAPEQKVMLETSASTARAASRKFMAPYLGMQNYRNNLLTLGFGEADFENGGSDRLVDAIVAWGDETVIRDRIEAHRKAGADHVALQPLRPDGEMGPDEKVVRAFAPKG